MEDNQDNLWHRAFRASILSAVLNKHVQYVGFADRRAQGIVAINSLIIPIAISGITHETYSTMAVVALVAAFLVIVFAVLSMYPKRYIRGDHNHSNLLHFSHIAKMSEEEYLNALRPKLDTPNHIIKMVARDLYHLSSGVLQPKFFWLRLSYFFFLLGTGIIVVLAIVKFIGR